MCVLDHMPFVHKRSGEEDYILDTKAIMQAIVVAVVTSVLNTVAMQQGIVAEMNAMQDDVREIKRSFKDDMADVKLSIREIRRDLYVPRK